MKYAVLSLLLLILSTNAGKNNEWVRVSFPKSQPSDLSMQDSLAELKAVIATKKFNEAYQMLNTVTLGGQLSYVKYLLSEVQFDYFVSKKDGSYQFVFPKQRSGNFLIKNRNTRNFFNYVLNEKRKEGNNHFMVLQLKNLKNIGYQSVFAKEVKTMVFFAKKNRLQ